MGCEGRAVDWLAAPGNRKEAMSGGRPAGVARYPRGQGVMSDWKKPFQEMKVGTGRKLADGIDIAILSIGHVGNYVTEVLERLDDENVRAAHYDMRFVKPLDEKMLHEVFKKYDQVITVEDGVIQGGFGSAVLEFMADHGYTAKVKRLGIPDAIIEHGSQRELHDECDFGPDGIFECAMSMLELTPAEVKK